MEHVRAIGLMSGTSLDGVDVALIETDGENIASFGPTAWSCGVVPPCSHQIRQAPVTRAFFPAASALAKASRGSAPLVAAFITSATVASPASSDHPPTWTSPSSAGA